MESAYLLHTASFWLIPAPKDSHHLFGAGFVFVGAIMLAENLAGGVWSRSRLRMMAFPAILVGLGWGMVAVTFVETTARFVHLAMGLPMIAGGWAEGRYRLGTLPRHVADAFLIPGLMLASLETALFHLDGPVTGGVFLTHGSLAVTAFIIAFLRLYQSVDPASLTRSLPICCAVLAVGFELYIDAIFQA